MIVVRLIFATIFILIGFLALLSYSAATLGGGAWSGAASLIWLVVGMLAGVGLLLANIDDGISYLARRERQRQAAEDRQRAAEAEPARQAAARDRQTARNHHREMRQGRRRKFWTGVDNWLLETMGDDGPAVRFFGGLLRVLAWGIPIGMVLGAVIAAAMYFTR